MKQATKAQRLIILLARGYDVKAIKPILDMEKETNQKYYDFIKETLEHKGFVDFFVGEILSISARKLNAHDDDYLPF